MPDTTQFNAPSTTKLNWWYVGGGIIGAIFLIYLMNKNNNTSSNTVSAGSSINASLGSIQENLLNLQGAQSQETNTVNALQTQEQEFAQSAGASTQNLYTTITQGQGIEQGKINQILTSLENNAQAGFSPALPA